MSDSFNNKKNKLESPNNRIKIKSRANIQQNDLSIDEIVNNETAIKIILSSYQEIEKENKRLKKNLTDLSLETGKKNLQTKNARVSVVFSNLSTLIIAFAVNYLTAEVSVKGLILFITGLVLLIANLYYAYYKKD